MSNPFSAAQLWSLADQFATPLWVYDATTIRERIGQLQAFDTIRFAQKSCSNVHILQLMRERGVSVDSVSRGEILRALAAGFQVAALRQLVPDPGRIGNRGAVEIGELEQLRGNPRPHIDEGHVSQPAIGLAPLMGRGLKYGQAQ